MGESISEPQSEEELESLMRRYQQAEADAASLLIDRISPQVFRFFLAQVRDRSRAEDLLQDFWLRVHKARPTYRSGEPVLPWIFGIARRVRIDDYRRRSRIGQHEFQSEELPQRAAQKSGPAIPYEVRDLLKNLPKSQRETIILLKVLGLSLEEVARATGTSVGAVKQKAHRAFETLRKIFGAVS
jgi:RNA polymerase sigma-70 factor, ECF subfamily